MRQVAGTPDLRMMFKKGDGKIYTMKITSDSDWAKDAADRRSTSCGVIEVNGCLLYSFSRTQTVVALSSGEAE
eukprot:13288239-Heterocapsa_arctica.AAC.1